MKQITKMSRLTGELEKAFRLINEELFNSELPTPIITVIPTPKAYAHYVPFDIWSTKESAKREINIASGTLDRPIENIIASLIHEMVHMYNDDKRMGRIQSLHRTADLYRGTQNRYHLSRTVHL